MDINISEVEKELDQEILKARKDRLKKHILKIRNTILDLSIRLDQNRKDLESIKENPEKWWDLDINCMPIR